MLPIAAFAALAIGLFILIRWAAAAERRRAQALAAAGAELDFSFAAEPGGDLTEILTAFEDRDRLRGKTGNVLSGTRHGRSWRLFDRFQLIAYGHTTRGVHESALLWRAPADLPDFCIEPMSLRYRLDREKADEDIERRWPKPFSKRFAILSDDLAALEAELRPAVFAFFEARLNLALHCRNGWLLLFRRNQQVRPEALATFLELGADAAALFEPGVADLT